MPDLASSAPPAASQPESNLDTTAGGRHYWLTRLRYFARQLAQSLLTTNPPGLCTECLHSGVTGNVGRHKPGCLVGQVLHCSDMTDNLELGSPTFSLATTPAPGPASAGAGDLSSAEGWNEPWRTDHGVLKLGKTAIFDCEDNEVIDLDWSDQEEHLEEAARRIAACVSFCAGIATEVLEKAAPHQRRQLVREALASIEAVSGLKLGDRKPRGEAALWAAAAELPAEPTADGLPYLREEDGAAFVWPRVADGGQQ